MNMEANAHPSSIAAPSGNSGRLLVIGNAALLVVALFVMTALLATIFALRGEVSVLQGKARQSAKATKAMRAEVAEIRDSLQEPEPEPASPAATAGGNALRAVSVPYSGGYAAAQPLKVRSPAPPSRTCVFRPGGGGNLADCIKLAARS